jgi:predicted RNase H-like HicB family nuclease
MLVDGQNARRTKANIREAILGHLQTLREYGDPIPPASSLAGEVEVTTAA